MEEDNNVVRAKSYAFALRIIELYQYLTQKKREYRLSGQLLDAGTSIGANVEESLGGYSERDFGAKMSIAYKESRETHYWLRLLRDSRYIEKEMAASYLAECDELTRITGSIVKTVKRKRN